MSVCTAGQHGTEWAVRKYRCRCPEAVAARRDRDQRRRRIRRQSDPRGRYANRYGHQGRTSPPPDPVAVERAAAGDRPVVLSKAERDAAIDLLDRLGLPAREVAARLGMTIRTVQRRRAARRQEQRLGGATT